MSKISTTVLLLIGAIFVAIFSLALQQPKLPEAYVQELIKSYSKDQFLEKYHIIVTGSTSGLGKSIASQLYKYGATVVIASRSLDKCISVMEDMKVEHPESTGSLFVKQLDLSDLHSVSAFSKWYTDTFDKLDFLVNNAGINYATLQQKATADSPLCSPQGYDLTFASNFMGHFLLTDLLLPSLSAAHSRGRIVQISSNAQFTVNGSDLHPKNALGDWPIAARCEVNTDLHSDSAYGNSKLAQMLHSSALQRRIDRIPELSGIKVVNVSPGLTLTSMIPPNPIVRRVLGAFMYSSEAASLSTLYAMFSKDISGGRDYVVNVRGSWVFGDQAVRIREYCSQYGTGVHKFCQGMFMVALGIQQRLQYGTPLLDEPNVIVNTDFDLADQLYDWSLQQVSMVDVGR